MQNIAVILKTLKTHLTIFLMYDVHVIVFTTIFPQFENTQKSKIKKILKHTYNTIITVRNLQKTGVSFHQVPLASDT